MPNAQSIQQNQPQPTAPQKKSGWWKWLLGGCGVLALLLIVVIVIVIAAASNGGEDKKGESKSSSDKAEEGKEKLSQEEFDAKLKSEAKDIPFVELYNNPEKYKSENVSTRIYKEGEVASELETRLPMFDTFTLKTEEKRGYGAYVIDVLSPDDIPDIQEGDRVKVWGFFHGMKTLNFEEETPAPVIMANIVELAPSGETEKIQPAEEVKEKQMKEPEEEVKQESQEGLGEVINISSSADKQTDTFSLKSEKQKIIYNTTGDEMTMCYVYVMKEGTSLDKQGGFPEITINGADSGETMMRKSGGDYYLDMKVVNGTCDIAIQELR